jgi:hypothetical protein
MLDQLEKKYGNRFVRTLNDKEKSFFIKNFDLIPELEKELHNKMSIPYDKTLNVITMSCVYDGEYDFLIRAKNLIDSEIRNHKISSLLGERKIYKFSDFKNNIKKKFNFYEKN